MYISVFVSHLTLHDIFKCEMNTENVHPLTTPGKHLAGAFVPGKMGSWREDALIPDTLVMMTITCTFSFEMDGLSSYSKHI